MWQLIPFAVGQAVAYDQTRKLGKAGEELAMGAEADMDLSLQRLGNIAENVGLSDQSYKLRDTYFQVAEELSRAGVADADELAQSIVAGIGDSREELAALSKIGDLAKGKRDARMEGALMKLQGEAGLTKRAEELEDTKRGLEFNIADTREMDMARINTGLDAKFGAQAAIAEQAAAAGNTISSSLIAASGTPDQRAAARTQRQANRASQRQFEDAINPAAADQRPGMFINPPTEGRTAIEGLQPGEQVDLGRALEQNRSERGFFLPEDDNYNFFPEEGRDYVDFPNQSGLAIGQFYRNEQGGYIGEQGGVTEGEFSHDTNKKAVIDEESGEKEGELTGGEVVFNPEQTDNIEGLVENRDAEGLLKYMTMLFSLPQFQEA
tara:strand:+ start:992 stop:2131 length:1140 start_codon:yes stop_codon:yes gene_type:complete